MDKPIRNWKWYKKLLLISGGITGILLIMALGQPALVLIKTFGGVLMAQKAWNGLLKAVVSLMGPILEAVTPALRKELVSFIQGWQDKAKKTPNQMDDVAAELIANLLDIPPAK